MTLNYIFIPLFIVFAYFIALYSLRVISLYRKLHLMTDTDQKQAINEIRFYRKRMIIYSLVFVALFFILSYGNYILNKAQ
jgi:choline-glycine betaine transporter